MQHTITIYLAIFDTARETGTAHVPGVTLISKATGNKVRFRTLNVRGAAAGGGDGDATAHLPVRRPTRAPSRRPAALLHCVL